MTNPIKTQYLGDGVYINTDQNPGHVGLTTGHHSARYAENIVWLEPIAEMRLLKLLMERNGVVAAE